MKLFILLTLLGNIAQAYLYSRTWEGKKLRWNATGPQNLYIDVEDLNSPHISSAHVENAITESLNRWNNSSPVKFTPVFTQNLPPKATKATFQFSSDPSFFGSGVLAVTSVSFNSSSGTIYGADIMMNDTEYAPSIFTGSKNVSSGSYAYVGDVINHEIGHLLGLNHSEVPGAAMIYSVFKGQHRLHLDDVSGIEDLYGTNSPTGIAGKVMGQRKVPIFGAHVQAIDLDSYKTVAGVFTDGTGSFHFKGLEPGKGYALYVSPTRAKKSLPQSFSTLRSDFCDGEDFHPAFFGKCGGRSSGRAQVVEAIEGETLNVGSVTVKCATSVHPKYLMAKSEGFSEPYLLWSFHDDYKTHATFTGVFTEEEISRGQAGIGDRLMMDLSGLDVSSLPSALLEVSVSLEKLGTATGAAVYAKRADQGTFQFHTYGTDPDTEKPELDFTVAIPLSNDSDDNVFELNVFPVELTSSEKQAVFASPRSLTNKKAIYFLSAQVKAYDGAEYYPVGNRGDSPYEDNSSCLESSPVETAKAYNPVNPKQQSQEGEASVSCATITGGGGSSGGGMGSFLSGIFIVCAAFALRGRANDFFV